MYILKSTHRKIVSELEKKIQRLEKQLDDAVLMYETVNAAEFKSAEQIKHGVTFMDLDDRRKYRIAEVSPEQFSLFRKFHDDTFRPSDFVSCYSMSAVKLFDELKNKYLKIIESPLQETGEK